MSGPVQKLGFGRILGFTVGDYAFNLYWQSVSLFLLFFYTDAVGLSAGIAGLIYMVASIFDAVIDPFMGAIADRTRTRWGRYRPYILFGCVPLGLSFVLLYWRPPFEGVGLALWMLATHIIFRTAYTVVTIPYTSLNARLTDSSDERSTIAGYRMVFGVLAALTIVYFTYPLVGWFGGSGSTQGFTWAAAVFALVATAIYPMVYRITSEPPESAVADVKLDLGGYWRALRGNRAFWILILATVSAFVCSVALGKSVLYYFKYYLDDEAASRPALLGMSAVGLVAIPAWVWITKFIGKRNAWFAGTVLNLVMLAIFAMHEFDSPWPMTIWLIASSMGSLGLALTFWSMLPDTVEYGEWRSGVRAESFIFGFGIFFQKVALGLAAGLLGVMLDLVGYIPNQPQTPETLEGIKLIITVFPTIGLIMAAVAMWLHPLRRGEHERISRELAERRLAVAHAGD